MPTESTVLNAPEVSGQESGGSEDSALSAEVHQRVRAAGGNVDGPIVVSLQFLGSINDIDLHVFYDEDLRRNNNRNAQRTMPGGLLQGLFGGLPFVMPPGHHIYFHQPRTQHAQLDVDSNATFITQEPVENVVFHKIPPRARYTIMVDCY